MWNQAFVEYAVGLIHFCCRASLWFLTATFYPSSSYFSCTLFYLSHLNLVDVFLFGTLSLYSQYFITVVTHPSVLCHSLFFMLAICPPESLVGQDYLLDGPLLSLPTTGGLILASSPSSLPAPSMDQFTTTALSSGQSHQGKNRMHPHLSCMSYMQRAIDCKVWFLFFTNSTVWWEKFL